MDVVIDTGVSLRFLSRSNSDTYLLEYCKYLFYLLNTLMSVQRILEHVRRFATVVMRTYLKTAAI